MKVWVAGIHTVTLLFLRPLTPYNQGLRGSQMPAVSVASIKVNTAVPAQLSVLNAGVLHKFESRL